MIKLYYIVMPVCAILQTMVMRYMALVLNKIAKRRKRHEH